jgi:hypothetical protein
MRVPSPHEFLTSRPSPRYRHHSQFDVFKDSICQALERSGHTVETARVSMEELADQAELIVQVTILIEHCEEQCVKYFNSLCPVHCLMHTAPILFLSFYIHRSKSTRCRLSSYSFNSHPHPLPRFVHLPHPYLPLTNLPVPLHLPLPLSPYRPHSPNLYHPLHIHLDLPLSPYPCRSLRKLRAEDTVCPPISYVSSAPLSSSAAPSSTSTSSPAATGSARPASPSRLSSSSSVT